MARRNDRTMERWNDGNPWTRLSWALVLLSILPSFQLSAQVGNDPANSPFRDIQLRAGPILFVGRLSNDRGRAGAGVSNALTIGSRYEVPAGRSLLLSFSAAYLQGDRFIIDPAADSSSPNRRTGPFDSNILLTDVGLQLRLTGAKTWRSVAPYVGIGVGLAFDLDSPGDTTGSGYRFGSRLTFSGATGIRWYPSRRLMLNADLRGQAWRLRYPVSFHTQAPDGSRVVPLEEALTDWTLHPWISLGVGWTF
jgi:hypothetical protein